MLDTSRVHPDLRAAFLDRPPFDLADAVSTERREGVAPAGVPDPRVRVEDRTVPGPAGAPAVRVRLYAPATQAPGRPGLVWLHGGGYVLGSALVQDAMAIDLCVGADCIVASVDYRLAPEHPFPAGLEDAYAALRWLAEVGPHEMDTTRIGVGGMSAGGGLAAALALLARDRGGPALAFQMPLCPMLDDTNTTASSREFTDPRVWNRDANGAAWALYLTGVAPVGGGVPAYAAPARATDLRGLPPAYIGVGALDPFRDEDIEYARRLSQAGVETELHVFPGCYHGFEGVLEADVALEARREYAGALRRGLHGADGADARPRT